MTGFDYGNARLRVRAASWLSASSYRGLLGASGIDGLLGSLAQQDYSEDVAAAMGRYRGLRRLDEAVRTHLSRQLTDVLSFYSGGIASRLGTYLSRWDIRNVRSILRDLTRRGQQTPSIATLVAAGAFDARALEEVAAQRDVRAAVDLLIVWGLPAPAIVRHLRHALPAFVETGDILVLERALDGGLGELAAAAQDDRDLVSRLMAREVDRLNLMSLLRLRGDAGQASVATDVSPVAGGSVSSNVWVDLADVDDAVLAEQLAHRLATTWRPAIAEWFEHRDLARLETSLDHAAAVESISLFRTGDPLGIEIPLGFIGQQEAEAANLRLIGRAVTHDLDREETFARLLGVVR
jgi:vacuolar-type H+-ATPase subunit C/Vma6